ncbi:toxin-antitoxin system YwqK family antitoxin [Rufibacter latericius]|nr:hypothetical protein [Rufibacter latericius]
MMKTKGRYKHGYLLGKWKTRSADKKLRKLEIGSLVEGKNLIQTTEYHANGQIFKKGIALLDRSGKSTRYYYTQKWQYYNEDGSRNKTVLYEEGWPVKTTFADWTVVISEAPPKTKFYKPGEKQNPPVVQ